MIFNWEKFQSAYSAASAETKNLIDSEQIPDCAGKMCLQYDIPSVLKKNLTVAMVNKILDLENELIYIKTLGQQGIPQIKAEEVLAALENCIFGKPSTINKDPSADTANSNLRVH
jgi:hypothetical protein